MTRFKYEEDERKTCPIIEVFSLTDVLLYLFT